MKLIAKTTGWAVISGCVFFGMAIANSCPWQGALVATMGATLFKTPAYPIWEVVFEHIWGKKKKLVEDYSI